jgi:O-antigen/teichoic acid export membrane protein
LIERVLTRRRNADADLKEVLRGSAIAFGVKILAAGSAFAMNVVIARQLGADEAGLFFLAYTIVFIAAAVSRLGLENTFVRFIAAHHASNEWGRIKGLYQTGIRWSLVASLCVATSLWLLADYLADEVFGKPAFADVMRIMTMGIPLTALFTLHANALQGIKRIPQSMTVLSVVAP